MGRNRYKRVLTAVLINCAIVMGATAQEVFPGGGSGSYNLSPPAAAGRQTTEYHYSLDFLKTNL